MPRIDRYTTDVVWTNGRSYRVHFDHDHTSRTFKGKYRDLQIIHTTTCTVESSTGDEQGIGVSMCSAAELDLNGYNADQGLGRALDRALTNLNFPKKDRTRFNHVFRNERRKHQPRETAHGK